MKYYLTFQYKTSYLTTLILMPGNLKNAEECEEDVQFWEKLARKYRALIVANAAICKQAAVSANASRLYLELEKEDDPKWSHHRKFGSLKRFWRGRIVR
jgi:hypothetical protein